MKLFTAIIFFLICLFINYRISSPMYEGFDAVSTVGNIVVYSFVGLLALLLIAGVVTSQPYPKSE